jgi:hypothetical protein
MARSKKYSDDNLVKIPDDLLDLVENIRDEYEREDQFDRDHKVALWSKLENYFNGIQRIYWNAVAKDWRSVDDSDTVETNRHYDKVVNTYRAHAESIIAALSVKIPSAFFYPADADVEEDVTTARACTKIKTRLEKQNQAQLLLIKTLLILFNQGTVAAYVYSKKDSKFGTYAIPKYAKEDAIQYTTLLNCAECGNNIMDVVFKKEKGKVSEETLECGVCGYIGAPVIEEYEETYPEVIGSTIESKSRTIIEIFSPLFVHLPIYARNQELCPYLCLKFEQHYAAVKELYPKLAKKGINKRIDQDSDERGIGVEINNKNLVTVECWWFRPWAYNIIDNKEDELKKLKDKYPDGIYAVFIDEQLVEINNEKLDDHWEISKNPLSTYIHGDPLGKPLAPIQDLSNEVMDLQIETFEHAIPETFVDGTVLDFKKYGESRAKPGMLYPATKPIDGQGLASAFHSIKTATMSEESDLFLRRLDEKGQFVSASFPSIYGGPATSGSKTAREYSESRSMALQRLSLTWNIEKYFWAGVMSKAVPLEIHALRTAQTDEKVVEKTSTGFVNNWITQADLNGMIGSVEADADEELPQTPAQLKDVIVQLLTLKDDTLTAAMYHPNNIPLIIKALGAPDFFIPDSDDRSKQFAEFADLLAGIEVEINPAIDDNKTEAEVCRSFLVSPTGQMLKKSNPAGYQAIEVHMKKHLEAEGTATSVKPAEEPKPAPGAENPEGVSNVAQFPVR